MSGQKSGQECAGSGGITADICKLRGMPSSTQVLYAKRIIMRGIWKEIGNSEIQA